MAHHPHLMRRRGRSAAIVALLVMAATAGPTEAARLTGAERLSRAYDRILDADFEGARALLGAACGRDVPDEACKVLEATALWWRIQLDPDSRAHDEALAGAVERAIAGADAWTAREPRRAEAWFYLGGAYAVRVQLRVLRGERLAAARDGKRIKDALERAVALDPGLADAYFGIGLYRYYAAVAPMAARILRWLLLLPGGSREEGLAQMLKAQEQGELLRSEADYQLYLINLWYEKKLDEAAALLDRLRARHPRNPIFRLEEARLEDVYRHDSAASLEAYESLLDAARRGAVNFGEIAEVQARLGLARQLEALHETDRAIDVLERVVQANPPAPHGAVAAAYLALGAAHDRLGNRQEALEAYDAALARAPSEATALRRAAAAGRRQAPSASDAEAYRRSLEGWRALEANALDEAEAALARALRLAPGDPLTRYRYGRLLAARGEEEAALQEFDRVIAARPRVPSTLLPAAYLDAGILLERLGDRTQAAAMYEGAASAFGGTARTRDAAKRALARLAPARPAADRRP